jgi:hypothetical protein
MRKLIGILTMIFLLPFQILFLAVLWMLAPFYGQPSADSEKGLAQLVMALIITLVIIIVLIIGLIAWVWI